MENRPLFLGSSEGGGSLGAAFVGFHFAMLSNMATGVILMPFAVALAVALLVSFVLGKA